MDLNEYDPEVYRKDWRYDIGHMVGYNKGLRHGVFIWLVSIFVSAFWAGFF